MCAPAAAGRTLTGVQRALDNIVVRSALSVWAWVWLAVLASAFLPIVTLVWLVTAPFDPGRYWAGYTFRQVAVWHQRFNPLWATKVTGAIPADKRRPYVVVANHESFVDILAIAHLPFETKWLSKDLFFKLPMIGQMMRMAGDIKVVRGDPRSRVRAARELADRLGKGVSVMVFPEGKRTRDGSLGEFHSGAFRAAIAAGVPVLPVAVIGTKEAHTSGGWRFGYSHAEVRVLDPIPTAGLTARRADIVAVREQAREAIAAALDEMRAGRTAAGR